MGRRPDADRTAEHRKWNGTDGQRNAALKYGYSMTLAEYELKLAAQGGVCRLCGTPPKKNRLCVDHDHKCCPGRKACGKCNRGLVCTKCNLHLGAIETPGWLKTALDYLEEYGGRTPDTWP